MAYSNSKRCCVRIEPWLKRNQRWNCTTDL